MNWTRIEEAKLVPGELYLCWDGRETFQSNNDNLPPYTTHVIRIIPPIDQIRIEYAILKYFELDREYLFADAYSRRRAHRYPRQLMWYIMKEYGQVLPFHMAKIYGFDHTTIAHAISTISNDIKKYEVARKDYEAILKLIQQQ
jgi:hypothetical protein